MIEKNNIRKAEDSFYNELIKHGINCITRNKVFEIYDAKKDAVNISHIIIKDNYLLYKYVKSTGKSINPGGVRLDSLKISDRENIIKTWDMADNLVFSLFKKGLLKDKGFNNMALDVDLTGLSIEEANAILKKYQNGTFEFNARNVLMLINNGAYIQRLAYTETNAVGNTINHYENDVFSTLMLKKYCEDIL